MAVRRRCRHRAGPGPRRPRMPGARPHGPGGGHAASRRPDGLPLHYARHRPEQTTLYRLLQRHAASFIAHTEATLGARLPRFIKDESDAFLQCGIPAHGFLRLRCGECAHDTLPAFSCKRSRLAILAARRRLRIQPQVGEDLPDHRPLEDRREDLQRPGAAARAGLQQRTALAGCLRKSRPDLYRFTRRERTGAAVRSPRPAAPAEPSARRLRACGSRECPAGSSGTSRCASSLPGTAALRRAVRR